jgi:hypothetical protein
MPSALAPAGFQWKWALLTIPIVVGVTQLDASGVRCLPSPPTISFRGGANTLNYDLNYDLGSGYQVQVAINGQQFSPVGFGLPFHYYTQLELSAVWPTGGPSDGGSPVTLYGIGFNRHGRRSTTRAAAARAAAIVAAAAASSTRANASDVQIGAALAGAADGDGLGVCLFGGLCYDEHGVQRGLKCRDAPRALALHDAYASPMALAAVDLFRGTAAVCRSPPLTPQPPPGARGRTSVRIAAAANGSKTGCTIIQVTCLL